LVFSNLEIKSETSIKSIPKPFSAARSKVALKKWEASLDGILFKKWEVSPAGIKVHIAAAKISKSVRDYANMEGVVTSLSLPLGSRLGLGEMVRLHGEDYILVFCPDLNSEFEQLHSLKVNDRIGIKSHSISKASKYAYPIVLGDYVERSKKVLYKRVPRKGGC
jgi:hypothetical protein